MATQPARPTVPAIRFAFGDIPALIKSSALTALIPLLVPGRVLRLEASNADGAERLFLTLPDFFSRRGLHGLRYKLRGNAVICCWPAVKA